MLSGDVKLPTNMRQRVANGTLFIDTVQRNADQGTYTCTARNKHNFTSHRSVEVRVLGKCVKRSARRQFRHNFTRDVYLQRAAFEVFREISLFEEEVVTRVLDAEVKKKKETISSLPALFTKKKRE